MSRAARILLRICACVVLLLALMVGCTFALWYEPPQFEREVSPSGRYDVVRRTQSFFLDGYEKVWITTHGEEDQDKWQLIGSEIDGAYRVHWESESELLVLNDGWPQPKTPYVVSQYRDVRIELQRRPQCIYVNSPDGRHQLESWSSEDSHGRRTEVILAASWNNRPRRGQHVTLCQEGPWLAEATWLSNDHVQLRIDWSGPRPPVTTEWYEIRIDVIQ